MNTFGDLIKRLPRFSKNGGTIRICAGVSITLSH